MVVDGPWVSTVKGCDAGVWSVLPRASRARTWNVWPPSETAAMGLPLVQDWNAPPSTEHWNVLDPSSGIPWNWNDGVGSLVVLGGPLVMTVSGGVVSTVKLRVAGE